jgi:DNA-binding beta-propeller fold protein YncE
MKWGTKGSGEAQFNGPYGVAVDKDNYVYVVDSGNCRIQKFDSNGNFITSWGSFGTGNGQFLNSPRWIAVDNSPYKDVYIADIGGYVYVFHNNGSFVTRWTTATTGESPGVIWGIAVDSDNKIYVTDVTNHNVKKFSYGGTLLAKWGSEGTGDGQFDFPTGIAIDSLGNIFVADLNLDRIQKFDSSGNFITKWGVSIESDKYSAPMGLSIDNGGNIWIADFNSPTTKKFNSSGKFLLKWGWYGMVGGKDDFYFYSPMGIAVDSSGNIYLTEDQHCRVQKFKE